MIQSESSELLQLCNDTFHTDYDRGELIWRTRPRVHFKTDASWKKFNREFSGKVAGCIDKRGYVRVRVGGSNRAAHRVLWALYYGFWPKGQIDHIDHNRCNNSLSNLRAASYLENTHNKTRYKSNSSGATGVYFHKRDKVWFAVITCKGTRHHLGQFTDFEAALDARKRAEKHHNFHENHGRAEAALICLYGQRELGRSAA